MTGKKGVRSVTIEDVGYIYFGIFRGEDVWGNWHDDDSYCSIETKDGKSIEITDLMEKAFGVSGRATDCAMHTRGEECDEEEHDECPYIDEKGICRPPLFKFKITVEAEPFNTEVKQTEK